MCKTGDFLDFSKVGPVEWKLGWAGRVVFGNSPGRFSVPVRPCLPRVMKQFCAEGFVGRYGFAHTFLSFSVDFFLVFWYIGGAR